MDEVRYGVYVLVDDRLRVLTIGSDVFLTEDELEGWVKVDEGEGDRYAHAQNEYLDGPTLTVEGIPRYALVEEDGAVSVVQRPEEDIQADIDALPEPETPGDLGDMEREIAELRAVVAAMLGEEAAVE